MLGEKEKFFYLKKKSNFLYSEGIKERMKKICFPFSEKKGKIIDFLSYYIIIQ